MDATQNFRDLDVVAVGPVVRELSQVYDRFWNGDWALPIAALVDRAYGPDDYAATAKAVRDWIATSSYPWPLERDVAELEREVLVETAYFVPQAGGVALAERLRSKGVRMRLLTNSLASNDVLAAFAGYSRYREGLVAAGVELHELRPDAGPIRQRMFFGVRGGSRAGLHTKAIVFDRKDVFIGSFNLDPRSSLINTEAGLFIESPELAAQVAAHMDEGVRLDNAYRVQLDPSGRLYWITEDAGKEIRYDVDPLSTPRQRLEAGWIRMLPFEDQL
jgi:putative cardiolipin synthase